MQAIIMGAQANERTREKEGIKSGGGGQVVCSTLFTFDTTTKKAVLYVASLGCYYWRYFLTLFFIVVVSLVVWCCWWGSDNNDNNQSVKTRTHTRARAFATLFVNMIGIDGWWRCITSKRCDAPSEISEVTYASASGHTNNELLVNNTKKWMTPLLLLLLLPLFCWHAIRSLTTTTIMITTANLYGRVTLVVVTLFSLARL